VLQVSTLMRSPAAPRPAVSKSVAGAESAVRAEASEVFSASFAAFFPTVISQVAFVGELLESKAGAAALSENERLLRLLLSNLSYFGAGVSTVDALEHSLTASASSATDAAAAVSRLFAGVSAMASKEAQELVKRQGMDAPELESGPVLFLKSLQRHLFARSLVRKSPLIAPVPYTHPFADDFSPVSTAALPRIVLVEGVRF
jgi:hypothetical protein